MRRNVLREKLNRGEPSLGTNAMILWPGVTEMIGHAGGFDYIQYEAEYVPFTLDGFDHLGRTIQLFDNMTSAIKVEADLRAHITKRAITSGIQNILFADVRNAADAEECVAMVRAETPATGGHLGSEDRRFASYWLESGTPEYVQALEDVVVALMIEKDEAVKDLDAILSVKGVDMIVFGPGDYSMSIGKPGAAGSKEVQDIHMHVVKTTLEHGVQPRPSIGGIADMERFTDLGVKHFCIGTDLGTIYRWALDLAPKYWEAMRG